MKGKKGQAITFGNAPRLILLFVLIGMVLGAGVIALASFRDTTRTSTSGLSTTFTGSNTTATSFLATTATAPCTSVTIFNVTNDITTSFTVTEADCTAIATVGNFNGITLTANYTAFTDSDTTTVIGNSIDGSVNLSEQLPTVGTILGVGLILVVVIGVFAFFAIRGV